MPYYNSVMGNPQEGIYYNNGKDIGNSLGLIFLKIKRGSNLQDIKDSLAELWTLYKESNKDKNLYSSIKKEIHTPKKMTVLIGYNNSLPIDNLESPFPKEFLDFHPFNPPNQNGGGIFVDETSLVYAKDIIENHPLKDDIVIQLIGDNEFSVYNTIIETWKKITEPDRNNTLTISGYYTGFKRDDKRSWLGFHDGVSNIPTNERYDAIFIRNNKNSLIHKKNINGTYLAFIRFEINLEKWLSINTNKQMEIIGRDKETGCPLDGVDKHGNPIKISGCPSKGTIDVLELPNQKFREPKSQKNGFYSYVNKSNNAHIFNTSHITRLYQIIKESKKRNRYAGIFRQGFEYFEPLNDGKNFRIGLNFISFQNDLKLFFDCIKFGFKSTNLNDNQPLFLEDFIMVRSAGVFFIPPFFKNEIFPGSTFFNEKRES